MDSAEEITLGGIARFDNGTVVARSKETVLCVEAKVGFASVFVKPVATEAVIRKDRPNVPIEIDGGLRCRGGGFCFACCLMVPKAQTKTPKPSTDKNFAKRRMKHSQVPGRGFTRLEKASLSYEVPDRGGANRVGAPP